MKIRSFRTVAAVALVAALVLPALAKGIASPLKLKVGKPAVPVIAGNVVDVPVDVRNRSADPVDETLEVFIDGQASPFATEAISLLGRESTSGTVALPVPPDAAGTTITVVARAGDAVARRTLKVGGSVAGGDPVAGQAIYMSNCSSCHSATKFAGKSPDKLLQVMPKGPGSMPVFTTLTRDDMIDLVAYADSL